ncbi:hypothetical protein RQP46_008138 [Phenoliferia psychrophenolica]
MTTVHSLAAEILSNIFELAHDPHTPSTMKSAALVCRAWRDPAQRTLFLDIAMPIVMGEDASREDWNRWCHYDSTRIHPPRRVELVQPQEPRGCLYVRGARALWVPGVRTLKIGAYSSWHLPIDFLKTPELSGTEIRDPYIRNQLNSTAAVLPASIERLGFKGVGNTTGLHPLPRTPFAEICDIISGDRLPNLTRLDFPDCKRKDLEDEAAAADLLAECERRSIRIVCWEEFI